jgi:hypothetical protein
MTINDLKGDLKALAIKRTKEHLFKYGFDFDEEDMNCDLDENFIFYYTPEGSSFWVGVNNGQITELPK